MTFLRSKMRELGKGYTSEVDTIDEQKWYELLDQFDDANIYQTVSYEEVRSGRKNVSHLLLKKDGVTVALAQSRMVKIPVLNAGIAYVRWGPVWRRRGHEADPEIFRQAIRALRNEYTCKRKLVLRLYPTLYEGDSFCASVLAEEGFSGVRSERADRTLRLNVGLSRVELLAGMRQHWKRSLKMAEKNSELEILEGTDDKFFEMFIGIYRELVSRKRFAEPNDIEKFRRAQGRLPERFKMRILLCKLGDEICAGLICSAIGNTGIYVFGATSDAGLKSCGSYVLHWTLIEWLKGNGFSIYDLHGIDPIANPGVYKFKTDLCGDNAQGVAFLGRFDSCTSRLSHICMVGGDKLRAKLRAFAGKSSESVKESPASSSPRSGSPAVIPSPAD